jgi:hypothetical protein
MNGRSEDEGRIRKRIAEIDQQVAALLTERDELLFAERILERLRHSDSRTAAPALGPALEDAEPDSIEEALLKLESQQFSPRR